MAAESTVREGIIQAPKWMTLGEAIRAWEVKSDFTRWEGGLRKQSQKGPEAVKVCVVF